MDVFKPDKSKITPDCLDIDDIFYDNSHGLSLDNEFTLCGYAAEEWNYNKILQRKRITCADCLAVIRHCRKYKL